MHSWYWFFFFFYRIFSFLDCCCSLVRYLVFDCLFSVVYSVFNHPFWGQTRSSVNTCLIFIEISHISRFFPLLFHFYFYFIVSVYWDMVASFILDNRQSGLERIHFRLLNGSFNEYIKHQLRIICILCVHYRLSHIRQTVKPKRRI